MEKTNLIKKVIFWSVGIFVSIILMANLWEEVDAGEIVVIQAPITGELNIIVSPGWAWQGGGKSTHYKKSNQYYFLAPTKGTSDEDNSLPVKFNDGGHAWVSGSIRYDLPIEVERMKKVHSIYGSQEAIENQLVKTNVQKSIFMTGPLMSSKESYAEKRNDLIFYIEDQASKGVYKTKQVTKNEPDPLTGEIKPVTIVEVVEKQPGIAYRQEESSIKVYGISLYNISINDIKYDKKVEEQIQSQQKAIMSVQSAIANAKRAVQDAITTEKQGEADAAKAKWEQEVIKATSVTKAEADKEVAALAVQTAELNKRKSILEGEGEAAKKRLVMQADGALTQKLQTYERVQGMWAKAFGEYGGNLVPTFMTGGGNSSNAGTTFMEMMSAKAMRDLSVDLKSK